MRFNRLGASVKKYIFLNEWIDYYDVGMTALATLDLYVNDVKIRIFFIRETKHIIVFFFLN